MHDYVWFILYDKKLYVFYNRWLHGQMLKERKYFFVIFDTLNLTYLMFLYGITN